MDAIAAEPKRLNAPEGGASAVAPASLVKQVCELAATMFDVPFAFVSLFDDAQVHVVAAHGLAPRSLPRDVTFCQHVARRSTPLVIEDARLDDAYQAVLSVGHDPGIRFYAGAPLGVDTGCPYGALCIADSAPRTLTASQVSGLRILAALVVDLLRHHEDRLMLARQSTVVADQQVILAQTERSAKIGAFEADLATGAMTWSAGLRRVFSVDAAVEATLLRFTAMFDEASQSDLLAALRQLEGGSGEIEFNATMRGATAPRAAYIQAEWCHSETGACKIVGIVQDVTERQAATAKLEWLATRDSLTGIGNRQAFNTELETAIRAGRQLGTGVAVIALDIDRFKSINDMLGHDAGDAVLVTVAERLTAAVGDKGTVARIGGDEFAVLISRWGAEGSVASLATRILFTLRQPFAFRNCELSTRATLGVALANADTADARDLLKNADIALYEAKQAGRDGFAFYRSTMRDDLERRLNRLSVARVAIEAGRFEAWYQPKICLRSGAVDGFEALLRWHHPVKGLCTTGDMGDALNDADVAVTIGHGMIDRVIADLRSWRDNKLDCGGAIALNVAEPEFHAGDYAEHLLRRLRANQLEPQAVEVEVTESVFLGHHTGTVARTLRKLADAGVGITLDDFGTGFASLTHLKQHPVSTIKIDRSFVSEIETDTDAATIVDALASLANSLRISIVAEGVETKAQLAFLRQRHCTAGQGYLFARPMPAFQVPAFLRKWRRKPNALFERSIIAAEA